MSIPLVFGSSEQGTGTKSRIPMIFGSDTGAGTSPGGSPLDLLAQLQAAQAAQAASQGGGHSLGGFVGNVFGGLKDLAVGIGQTLGALTIEPLVNLTREAAGALTPLPNPDTHYSIDDIARGIIGMNQTDPRTGEYHPGIHLGQSAIARDLGERYGMLMPGGRPASQIMEQLYQKPVPFALDAATVASAGAGAAAKLGEVAIAGNEAAMAAKAATLASLEGAAREGLTNIAPKSIAQASTRAGVTALGEEASPLMRLASKLLPQETYRVIGDRFIPTTTAQNAVWRGLEAPLRKLTTEPLAALENTMGARTDSMLSGVLDRWKAPSGTDVGTRSLEQDILAGATQRGMTRVEKDFFRNSAYPKVLARRSEMRMGTENLMRRQAEIAKRVESIHHGMERDAAEGTTNMDRYVDRSTALDVNIEGVAPDPGMAIRTGDLNGPTISLLPQENLGNYTFGPGELDQLARVDPVFAKRTADVVGGLDEVIAKWERDRPRIEAFNAEKGRTVIDVEQEIANAHRLQRGLIDGLRKKVSDGEAITSDTQAWIETRLSDMEIRLEKLKSGEVDPTSMLRRNFFALKEKHRTGGVAPTKPVMSAVKNIQARVEELASLEQEIRALVAGKTPQGAIRAVRKMLGESRFASSRELLSKLADDPAALVDQLVRDNPEGGMLKQVLDMTPRESSHILGVRQGVVSKTERGKVYSGLEGVSPDAATPIARKVKPTTKATTSGTGVAASLASELRDAIGGDANYNLIFGEAKSAAEIRAQLRAIVEDPIGMQRKILTGVDNSPSAEILSDSLHAAGHQDPTYYPYISEERQTKSVFFPNRSAKGANIKARDPSEQRLVGSLLREGDYIRDPVEAMTQRAARVAKTENTWRSMSHRIKSTGRIVTDAESVPEGWVAVSPDALFFNHRTRMDFLNHVEDLRLAGVAPEQAFKQALEAVTIKAQDDIESLLGHAAGEGKPAIYAIPRVVYDEMGAAADWGKVAGKPWVRSGWDPMMNAWRGLVLSGSPRWIVNNVLGNTVFAAMQGVKVADVVRILTERLRGMAAGWAAKHGDLGGALSDLIGGKDLRPNSLAARAMKDLPGGSSVGSGFFNSFSENYRQHLGEAATTPMGKIVEKSRTVGNKSMVLPHKIATFMRNLNSEIEASYREASFLTAIEKQAGKTAIQRTGRSFWGANKRITDIMENGFDEAKAKLALDEVNHFMGDYTTMGPFERHVVRRFVFPFWGFYRHATKLIVSFPFEYPLRAQVMMGLANVTKDLMDQYGPMPQWLQGAIPMSPPGAEVSFLRTAGANPFQGVTQDWTSMLSPPLKMMLERAQGKQSFTGNKFTDENTFTPFGSDQSYDLRTLQPTEGNVLPSIMEQLAQQVPQYTMLKDLVAGGSSYDTASLGDILGGHGVIRDPTTGAPRYPVGAGELLAKFLGAPVSNIDLGAFQARQTSDQKQALAEAIRRLQALGVHP